MAGSAVLLSMTASPALASSSDDPTGTTVVIGDREYGPADGVEVESGDFPTLNSGPYGENLSIFWGLSYVREYEQQQIRHTGTAHAHGDVYQGKRTIRVSFRFYRGSTEFPWKHADAVYSGGSWKAATTTSTVYDSLIPGAGNTTKMRYNRVTVSPSSN